MSIAANGPNPTHALFHRILNALQKSTAASGYRLAEDSGLDRAYISRLLNGERDNPSYRAVMKLCLAFNKAGATRAQLDGLLISAGFLPVYELTDDDIDFLIR